jgi:hypothetical protein
MTWVRTWWAISWDCRTVMSGSTSRCRSTAYSRNGGGGRADFIHTPQVGHGVDELHGGIARHPHTDENHDQAHDKSTVAVGVGKTLRLPQGQPDCDQGRHCRERVHGIVPRVGHEGVALETAAVSEFKGGKCALGDQGKHQRPDYEGRYGRSGTAEPLKRTEGNQGTGRRQKQADEQAREDFHAPMSVRVICIWGLGC